jgi:hypothetical protein
MEIVYATATPSVNSHSQTRAARVLFRDPVEFSLSSLAVEIRWHSLSWLGKRIAEGESKN